MCVLKTARANVKGPGSMWPKRRSGVLPAAPAPGRVPRPLSPSAGKDSRTHGPAPGAAPASEAASPRPVCPTALLCPPSGRRGLIPPGRLDSRRPDARPGANGQARAGQSEGATRTHGAPAAWPRSRRGGGGEMGGPKRPFPRASLPRPPSLLPPSGPVTSAASGLAVRAASGPLRSERRDRRRAVTARMGPLGAGGRPPPAVRTPQGPAVGSALLSASAACGHQQGALETPRSQASGTPGPRNPSPRVPWTGGSALGNRSRLTRAQGALEPPLALFLKDFFKTKILLKISLTFNNNKSFNFLIVLMKFLFER